MPIKTHVQKNRKVTLSLPVALMEDVRRIVQDGMAPSQNAFVVQALQKEIRARRAARLREEFRQAAADPDFLRDIEETMHDFGAPITETWRREE